MEKDNIVGIKLPSGCNVVLSKKIYDECYCNFDELKWFSFNNFINAELYFPQIMQFITVIFYICSGFTSFKDILLCNLIMGIGYTMIWYIFKLYKLPGLSYISCFIGGNIFRFFLHFVVITIISIFFIKKWQIIIFCLISGFITAVIKAIITAKFSTVKYNDEVAIYVSKFKNTQEVTDINIQNLYKKLTDDSKDIINIIIKKGFRNEFLKNKDLNSFLVYYHLLSIIYIKIKFIKSTNKAEEVAKELIYESIIRLSKEYHDEEITEEASNIITKFVSIYRSSTRSKNISFSEELANSICKIFENNELHFSKRRYISLINELKQYIEDKIVEYDTLIK